MLQKFALVSACLQHLVELALCIDTSHRVPHMQGGTSRGQPQGNTSYMSTSVRRKFSRSNLQLIGANCGSNAPAVELYLQTIHINSWCVCD